MIAMRFQLLFAREILCKSYDDKGFRRLELVKTGLKTLNAYMVCIKA